MPHSQGQLKRPPAFTNHTWIFPSAAPATKTQQPLTTDGPARKLTGSALSHHICKPRFTRSPNTLDTHRPLWNETEARSVRNLWVRRHQGGGMGPLCTGLSHLLVIVMMLSKAEIETHTDKGLDRSWGLRKQVAQRHVAELWPEPRPV